MEKAHTSHISTVALKYKQDDVHMKYWFHMISDFWTVASNYNNWYIRGRQSCIQLMYPFTLAILGDSDGTKIQNIWKISDCLHLIYSSADLLQHNTTVPLLWESVIAPFCMTEVCNFSSIYKQLLQELNTKSVLRSVLKVIFH